MSRRFKAVTWNVYAGTGVRDLRPILREQIERRVSIILLQEAQGDDITNMLREQGFGTFAHKQYRVAWKKQKWALLRSKGIVLSKTNFFAKDGDTPIWSEGARVRLAERDEHRTLDVVSYHTPAHVQGAEKMEHVPRRVDALVETMVRLGEIADNSRADAVLFGGDDNWDENTGFQANFTNPILLGRAIGLRQLQSGLGTHGRHWGRDIDDFRIKRGGGIRPVGEPWVAEGGGDHRLHGRKFEWR